MQRKQRQHNNAHLWDDIWSESEKDKNIEEFYAWVKRESSGIRGTKIQNYIFDNLGELQELKAIEVGSGLGVYSYILAQAGVDVTLLDYSKKAINIAKSLFQQGGLKADFLINDALSIDANLYGKYDLAISFGTVEHFQCPERLKVMEAHTKLVRKGGIVVISVPNKAFLMHEFLKAFLCFRHKWKLGYEGAFTHAELFEAAKALELSNIKIIGSAFLSDFQRYLRMYRSTRLAVKCLGEPPEKSPITERASYLDNIFGADLVLLGVKN